MQTLNLDSVKYNARKAHAEKRLTAQAESCGQRQCVYRMGTLRCAIGASLTNETLDELNQQGNNTRSIRRLIGAGTIEIAEEDRKGICDIQQAHDSWCGYPEGEEYFLQLIAA